MRLRSPSPSPCARQSGVAAVEFALILALLITIVAGIVEFGRTFWYYDALSKATRNAARSLAVSNPAILTTAVAAAKTAVSNAAASANLPSFTDANVSVVCLNSTMNTIACTDGVSPAGVRVSVTGYSVFLGSSIPFLVGGSNTYLINLTPATTMPYMR